MFQNVFWVIVVLVETQQSLTKYLWVLIYFYGFSGLFSPSIIWKFSILRSAIDELEYLLSLWNLHFYSYFHLLIILLSGIWIINLLWGLIWCNLDQTLVSAIIIIKFFTTDLLNQPDKWRLLWWNTYFVLNFINRMHHHDKFIIKKKEIHKLLTKIPDHFWKPLYFHLIFLAT